MAIVSQSSSSWILSLKVLLISSGFLSMAVVLKISFPLITDFAISELPSIWSFLVSWLRPPYLYLVINFIIITIVATSKLQQKVDQPHPETVVQPPHVKDAEDLRPDFVAAYGVVTPKSAPVVEILPEFGLDYDVKVAKASEYDAYGNVDSRVSEVKTTMTAVNAIEEADGGDEFSIFTPSWTPETSSSEYSFSTVKPPVSMRFGHRKAVKASPEGGRTLRVSKPKRHDTLESTWKTITDGRPMPLTRHLKKSDTWETHGRHVGNVGQDHHPQDERMKKSETFNDRSGGTNSSPLSRSSGSGKLKRDPSLSQDELNKRVEAFINKFNEEMRLQRQESLNQYMEMINRGAH